MIIYRKEGMKRVEQRKPIEGIETINMYTNEEVNYMYLTIKRIMDFILSLIGLVLLLPVFIIISIFYLFGENRGPLFFAHKRIGKNGRYFHIYKFRTMIVNAEEKLKSDKELYKKFVKNGYKLETEEDPRITKLGRFLRKTSLDELPQLVNVLLGNMSLVGPRPIIEAELAEYKDRKQEFLSVKPGVTGYWQVSGRSDVGYPERVDLELYYVHNKSLLFDIKILFKTFTTVIFQKGAY